MSVSVAVGQLLENELTALAELSPTQRGVKFRELASEAKRSAANAQGMQRQTLIESAGIWQRLATLAEQEIKVDKLFGMQG